MMMGTLQVLRSVRSTYRPYNVKYEPEHIGHEMAHCMWSKYHPIQNKNNTNISPNAHLVQINEERLMFEHVETELKDMVTEDTESFGRVYPYPEGRPTINYNCPVYTKAGYE